ncbi:zinc finger protein 236-like [Mya arenaria]|uniref:zinc finger protein 236-like n=1 Tax=Mya arenaria TaxID=6604 RepID=UPI0022E07F30|nr:zinc finger protein 236-like [Mya arenaria]
MAQMTSIVCRICDISFNSVEQLFKHKAYHDQEKLAKPDSVLQSADKKLISPMTIPSHNAVNKMNSLFSLEKVKQEPLEIKGKSKSATKVHLVQPKEHVVQAFGTTVPRSGEKGLMIENGPKMIIAKPFNRQTNQNSENIQNGRFKEPTSNKSPGISSPVSMTINADYFKAFAHDDSIKNNKSMSQKMNIATASSYKRKGTPVHPKLVSEQNTDVLPFKTKVVSIDAKKIKVVIENTRQGYGEKYPLITGSRLEGYFCHTCKMALRTIKEMRGHKMEKHEPDNRDRYRCGFCFECFDTQDAVQDHMDDFGNVYHPANMSKEGEKKFCERVLNEQKQRKIKEKKEAVRLSHIDRLNNVDMRTPDHNTSSATSGKLISLLNRAMEDGHEAIVVRNTGKAGEVPKVVIMESMIKEENLLYSCKYCRATYSFEEDYLIHLALYHIPREELPKFSCEVVNCGQIFGTEKLLEKHILGVHVPMTMPKGQELTYVKAVRSGKHVEFNRRLVDEVIETDSFTETHVDTNIDNLRWHYRKVPNDVLLTEANIKQHEPDDYVEFYNSDEDQNEIMDEGIEESDDDDFENQTENVAEGINDVVESTLAQEGDKLKVIKVRFQGGKRIVHVIGHKDDYKQEEYQFFHCPNCPRKYLNTANLSMHMEQHSNEKVFKCPFCSRVFSFMFNLQKHKKTHYQYTIRHRRCKSVNNFCQYCAKAGIVNIDNHSILHTYTRGRFMCDGCARLFHSKVAVEIHRKYSCGRQLQISEEKPDYYFVYFDDLLSNENNEIQIPFSMSYKEH